MMDWTSAWFWVSGAVIGHQVGKNIRLCISIDWCNLLQIDCHKTLLVFTRGPQREKYVLKHCSSGVSVTAPVLQASCATRSESCLLKALDHVLMSQLAPPKRRSARDTLHPSKNYRAGDCPASRLNYIRVSEYVSTSCVSHNEKGAIPAQHTEATISI